MSEGSNPVVPTWFDGASFVLPLLLLTLAIWAWISIARSALTLKFKLLWALIVLALPVLGSATWLLGRRRWQQGSLPPN